MPPSAPSAAVRLAAPPRGVVAVVVLLLRAGIGLDLLTRGLMGYWVAHARNGGSPFADLSMMGPGGGVEAASLIVPYLEMAAGLAVLAGFLTVYSAAAAGVASLLPMLLQAVMMLVLGGLPSANVRNSFGMGLILNAPRSQALLPIAVLMWLASTGVNPLSLDAWIGLHRGQDAGPAATNPERPSATGGE